MKSIVISSAFDSLVQEVIDWALYFGFTDIVVISEEDFFTLPTFININNLKDKRNVLFGIKVCEINKIWFRKIDLQRNFSGANQIDIINATIAENSVVFDFLCEKLFRKNQWINNPIDVFRSNKLMQQQLAIECGFVVPDSYLSNRAETINSHNLKSFITKSIKTSINIDIDGEIYSNYTTIVNLSEVPSNFGVTFFQSQIFKIADIKSCFIFGEIFALCYIVAPVNDNIDYRNACESPVFYPFQLPIKVENNIKKLMITMDLQFATIDFVLMQNGEIVFLEVNPSGIVDSNFCMFNFHIGKILAKHLIDSK